MAATEQKKSEGFHREDRLLKPDQFKRVFSKPAYKAGDNALLCLVIKNGLEKNRLGLAISKKSVKRAVGRNRIKRQIREFFRKNRDSIEGYDVVFVSRHGIAELDNNAITDRLGKLWSKLESKCAKY